MRQPQFASGTHVWRPRITAHNTEYWPGAMRGGAYIGESNLEGILDKLKDDQFLLILRGVIPACQMGMVIMFMPFLIPETAQLVVERPREYEAVCSTALAIKIQQPVRMVLPPFSLSPANMEARVLMMQPISYVAMVWPDGR